MDDDEAGTPIDPVLLRARLQAAVAVQPIDEVLRGWFVLDLATGLLIHRHCARHFWRQARRLFCPSCGKVLLETLADERGVRRDLPELAFGQLPQDFGRRTPECLACWLGASEESAYFSFASSLLTGLLWQRLDDADCTVEDNLSEGKPSFVFRHAGANLHLHVRSDIYGTSFASAVVVPHDRRSAAQWARAQDITVVRDGRLQTVAGALLPDAAKVATIRQAEADVRRSTAVLARHDEAGQLAEAVAEARDLAGALQSCRQGLRSIAVQRDNLLRLQRLRGLDHWHTLYAEAMLAISQLVVADRDAALVEAAQLESHLAHVLGANDEARGGPAVLLEGTHRQLATLYACVERPHEALRHRRARWALFGRAESAALVDDVALVEAADDVVRGGMALDDWSTIERTLTELAELVAARFPLEQYAPLHEAVAERRTWLAHRQSTAS